jgi:hypothetical protein
MERAGSSLLPHSVSMMLCDSITLKGCATRPGKPARPLTATPSQSKWPSFRYGKMGIGSTIPIEPTALM